MSGRASRRAFGWETVGLGMLGLDGGGSGILVVVNLIIVIVSDLGVILGL
jgi:hypothetical protein